MKTRVPQTLGVVNLTEDSFSDGGQTLDPGKAVERALALVEDGADVIDLGPASSHPDAARVSPEEEIRRLAPVLDELKRQAVPISVDSFRQETQRYALQHGASYLNDIHGFPDPAFHAELARSQARLIVMHSIQQRGRATRVATLPEALPAAIDLYFEQRVQQLEEAGVARDRIILDPGMGFFLGDRPEPSLLVLRQLDELKRRHRLPLLVSVSRKSFLGAITGRAVEERGPATLAAELFAARQGVDYIRTHDVRALRDALRVSSALEGRRGG